MARLGRTFPVPLTRRQRDITEQTRYGPWTRITSVGEVINDYTRQVGLQGDGLGTDDWTTVNTTGTTVNIANDNTNRYASRFTASKSTTVNKISTWIAKVASPTDQIAIEIRDDNSGVPGNNVLVTGSIDNSIMPATTPDKVPITLSNSFSITAGTNYWVVIYRTSGTTDNTNKYNIQRDALNTTLNKFSTNSGASWNNPAVSSLQPFNLTSPIDSSWGLWRGSTNLVTNGGFEIDTSGWGGHRGTETLSTITSDSKFGSACLSVVTPGSLTAEGVNQQNTTISGSTVYSGSVWVKAPNGATLYFEIATTNFAGPLTAFVGTGSWQRITGTFTSDPADTTASIRVYTRTSAQAITILIDGAQLEQQPYPTPYIDTYGATRSRAGSYVQAPTSVLNNTQSWAAVRYRVEQASTSRNENQTILSFYDGTVTSRLYYNAVANRFTFVQGGGSPTSYSIGPLASGDIYTVVIKWTSGSWSISVNGNSFVTDNTHGLQISTITLFGVGIDITPTALDELLDGEILWVAAGTGTLSDSDATSIHAFGDAGSLTNWPSLSAATFYWPADTDVWYVPTLASGTAYTESATLTSKTSLSATETAQFVEAATVSTTTDISSSTEIYTPGAVAYTESATISSASSISAVETAQYVESSTASTVTTLSSSDVAADVDSSTTASTTTPSASEVTAFVEASTTPSATSVSATDIAAFVDSATATTATTMSTTELHEIPDSGTSITTTTVTAVDVAAFVDAATVSGTISVSLVETAAFTDTSTVPTVSSISFTEIAAFVDSSTLSSTTQVSAVETYIPVPQHLLPISDVTTGSWLPSDGTSPLYSLINETAPANTSTYIYATAT